MQASSHIYWVNEKTSLIWIVYENPTFIRISFCVHWLTCLVSHGDPKNSKEDHYNLFQIIGTTEKVKLEILHFKLWGVRFSAEM